MRHGKEKFREFFFSHISNESNLIPRTEAEVFIEIQLNTFSYVVYLLLYYIIYLLYNYILLRFYYNLQHVSTYIEPLSGREIKENIRAITLEGTKYWSLPAKYSGMKYSECLNFLVIKMLVSVYKRMMY